MKLDIKLYRGYVNDQELIVFGHVFESWSPDRYRIDRKGIKHALSIFRMFTIDPLANIDVHLEFGDLKVRTKTLSDGYFRFTVPYDDFLESGWHTYTILCRYGDFNLVAKGELLKPYKGKLGIISDIDDTFLISHSNNFFKKIYVLLSKNINKRQIFDDVVAHYQALSLTGQNMEGSSNSFFYVSSSEWNLYPFIAEFATLHHLPKAIIKLKKIKTGIADFLFTGKGSHDHKFEKIKDIIAFYPNLNYVLLGDDSQKDPFLYERVCKVFPMNIKAVYIRLTTKHKKDKVVKVLKNIESLSVKTLYFKDSLDAIAHSKANGIIEETSN
ncbi:App1 family protein [Pareuzebyella sediminis]|uniref:App1 family protein n=1 Tax=Pareuzebyella sediminis TaxID=2607998 RepID=UPI0011EBA169|nr:App1 family protein [Pareuzebyella sediminis]